MTVALNEAGAAAAPVAAAEPPAPRARWSAALPRVPPALRDVVLLATVLVLLFTGFALWYWRHSSARQSPPPMTVVAPRVEAPPVVQPAAPKKTLLDPEPLTPAEAAILAEPPPVVPMPIRPPRAVPGPAPAPTAPPVRAAAPSDDPLAPCRGRNVFARAICMNNQCAQPANATHPQCVQVRRQRQLDEARRNLSN